MDDLTAVVASKPSMSEFRGVARAVIVAHNTLAKEFQAPQYAEQIGILASIYKDMLGHAQNWIAGNPTAEQEYNNLKVKALTSVNALVASASTVTRNELTINEAEANEVSKQYTYVTMVLPLGSDLPPVIKQNQTHFVIENEKKQFNRNTYALHVLLDIYQRDFLKAT